jgi:hypothetical protein
MDLFIGYSTFFAIIRGDTVISLCSTFLFFNYPHIKIFLGFLINKNVYLYYNLRNGDRGFPVFSIDTVKVI